MQEIRNNDVKMIEYVQRWFVGDLPLSSYLPKGMPLIDVKVRKEPVGDICSEGLCKPLVSEKVSFEHGYIGMRTHRCAGHEDKYRRIQSRELVLQVGDHFCAGHHALIGDSTIAFCNGRIVVSISGAETYELMRIATSINLQ